MTAKRGLRMSTLSARFRDWLIRNWRSPLFWILVIAGILRIVGLGWGLPASDGWDSDGIAPRDFLPGVVQTYQPGDYFTYPPLHLLILTILTAPGWIAGLVNAPSFAQADVVAEFIKIPYMTFFAIVARLVSVAMSLGTIVCVGKMGEELAGRRAGICVAAVCAMNATLTYYGHTTNLDGPYLFWAALSILLWMRVMAHRDLHLVRWALLSAVTAIATKDQAYAVFLLGLPLGLGFWFAVDTWPRSHARQVISVIAVWGLVALFLLLLVDGAITNPSGFRARLAFLVGPASQNHAYYSRDISGYVQLLRDGWNSFSRYYPAATAYLAIFGIAGWLIRRNKDSGVWAAGLLPFFCAVSFTVAFNLVALRSDHRFLLPQSIFLSVYIGLAVHALIFAASPIIGWASRAGAAVLAGLALIQCMAIDAEFLNDPRYDAERWLSQHANRDDRIETYGSNVYLPRFRDVGRVTRVDQAPIRSRNPLPGVVESDQPFGMIESRSPRFIVVTVAWAGRYLPREREFHTSGRILSPEQKMLDAELPVQGYFRDLHDGKLPYRLRYEAAYRSKIWPTVHIHESLAETIRIFERADH